jgi:hypothetical protein
MRFSRTQAIPGFYLYWIYRTFQGCYANLNKTQCRWLWGSSLTDYFPTTICRVWVLNWYEVQRGRLDLTHLKRAVRL